MVSTSLSLLGAELIFRIFDIRPAVPPRPQHLDAREVDNSRNRLGLRESWDSLPNDGRLRIAFLGDSFTYGESVEPDQTFCRRVGERLDRQVDGGAITINVGQPGTGPGGQFDKYLAVRHEIRPDVVVHVIYLNDLGPDLHALVNRIYKIRDEDFVLGRFSYVLHYAERQVRYRLAWRDTLAFFRGGLTSEEQGRNWEIFKADVRKCKAAAESGDGFYCLVVFPWLYRLKDYPLEDLHQRLQAFAEELDVPLLDLLPGFEGLDDSSLRISDVNEHPSTLGHERAAELIAPFLLDEVLPRIAHRPRHGSPTRE